MIAGRESDVFFSERTGNPPLQRNVIQEKTFSSVRKPMLLFNLTRWKEEIEGDRK